MKAALAMCLALWAAGICHAADERRVFDIAAGSAVASLNRWAEQAGLSLLGEFDRISRLRTRAVHGRYTPDGALREMTRGTGITCKLTRPKVMWCSLKKEPAPEPVVKIRQSANPPSPSSNDVVVTGTRIRGVSPIGARRIILTDADVARTIADACARCPRTSKEDRPRTLWSSGVRLAPTPHEAQHSTYEDWGPRKVGS